MMTSWRDENTPHCPVRSFSRPILLTILPIELTIFSVILTIFPMLLAFKKKFKFCKIIYHDFLLPSRRGSHVTSDYAHTIINTHPLAHIPGTCSLIFIFSLPQPLHVTASHPSAGDILPERGRVVRKNAGPCKNGRVKLNHLHMHQGSPLLPTSLSASHRHPTAAQRTSSRHPSSVTSVYTVPALHLHPQSTLF